jgi:hypothetical protein
LEQMWREWAREMPRNPDMAFVGFCRGHFNKHGRP